MTAEEMQQRNGKAQQLRVIEVEAGQPSLDDRFIRNIDGRDFVVYAGVLHLAHQKGLIKMAVEILQYPTAENGHMAIAKATVESKLGELFVDVGDACPTNCNAKVAKHLLRMASTRAKARALRDFSDIGITCLEELGDLNGIAMEEPAGNTHQETAAAKKGKPDKKETSRPVAPAPEPQTATKGSAPPAQMSTAQERAILNLAKRRGLSQEELEKLAKEAYGAEFKELSVADASQMIRHLQVSA
jgi:hypothetical protein